LFFRHFFCHSCFMLPLLPLLRMHVSFRTFKNK
jgi:hypothetical protein